MSSEINHCILSSCDHLRDLKVSENTNCRLKPQLFSIFLSLYKYLIHKNSLFDPKFL